MHTPSSLVRGETASADFAVEQGAAGGERVTGRPAISVAGRRDFASVLRRRAGLLAVCALAAVLGGARLGDEGYVSLHGDMPKFLMNGVFLLDMARDLPFSSENGRGGDPHDFHQARVGRKLGVESEGSRCQMVSTV